MIDHQQQYMQQNPYGDVQQPNEFGMGMQRVDNKDPGFLQWFLDNKEGIDNLKFLWRGWERDIKGVWNKTTYSEDNRIMNEKGIHWATAVMENYLDKVFQSSNFDNDHMNWEMRKAVRVVWFGLITQYKRFELSKVNTQVVASQCLAKIHAMMLASRGQGIRDFLTKSQQISEVRQVNPNDNKGFFSGISGIFSRNNNNNYQ